MKEDCFVLDRQCVRLDDLEQAIGGLTLLTEKSLRQRIETIWHTEMHPVRRAKALLRMSHQAKALAHFLLKLGFNAHHTKDPDRTKRFWSASSSFFSLADEVRGLAGRALRGKEPQKGFGYGPLGYAVPNWDKGAILPPHPEVKE